MKCERQVGFAHRFTSIGQLLKGVLLISFFDALPGTDGRYFELYVRSIEALLIWMRKPVTGERTTLTDLFRHSVSEYVRLTDFVEDFTRKFGNPLNYDQLVLRKFVDNKIVATFLCNSHIIFYSDTKFS